MNHYVVSTIDTNCALNAIRYENCLKLRTTEAGRGMERTVSNNTLFIDIIVAAILFWFILVNLDLL